MFHLFTIQGKRLDTGLEQLQRNPRVHHTKSNNRVRKFSENGSFKGSGTGNGAAKNGIDTYKEASMAALDREPVFHASEIMSYPVFTIKAGTSVYDAWSEFSDKMVHHMPVVSDEGLIIGIVSDRDLLKKIIISGGKIETSKEVTVAEVMSMDVIATSPLTDIRRIAKAMLDNHIGAMPVVDNDGKITGIITRSDILFAIIHHQDLNLWA